MRIISTREGHYQFFFEILYMFVIQECTMVHNTQLLRIKKNPEEPQNPYSSTTQKDNTGDMKGFCPEGQRPHPAAGRIKKILYF